MKTSVYSSHYDKLRSWLKTQRDKSGLSLREVSLQWGRHHSILGKIEQSGRRLELIEFLELCHILGADPVEGMLLLNKSLHESEKVK